MSADARNSLIAWGVVLGVAVLIWAAAHFLAGWEVPRWAEPYFWALLGILIVADIVRLALPQRRRDAQE